jgi:hypothetical protein
MDAHLILFHNVREIFGRVMQTKVFLWFLLLGVTVIKGNLAAQKATIPLAKPIQEHYDPHMPVSGAELVSIATTENDASVDDKTPSVYVPASVSGKLCLSIASRDGTYTATAEYALNGMVPKVYVLSFQSEYREFRSFKLNDLASLAEMKDDCSSAPPPVRKVLPIFWSRSTLEFPLRILLQADEADARVRASGKNGNSAVQCSEIRTGSKAVFDEECLIPDTWEQFLKDPVEIDISNFGNHQPPLRVLIAIP